MFVFSRSFLVAYLLVTSTFIECGPLNKTSSVKNESTSMPTSSLDFASFNDSSSLLYSTLSNESLQISGKLSNDDSSSVGAINVGSGVRLVAEKMIKLLMARKSLDFDAKLKSCTGDTLICYKALPGGNDKAKNLCPPNYCGFKLSTDASYLRGIDFSSPISLLTENSPIHMKAPTTSIYGVSESSCDPAFEDGDILLLDVRTLSKNCQIEIPNAQVYQEPTPPSSPNGAGKAVSSNAGLQWYHWFVIATVIVLVFALVFGGILICWGQKIVCFKVRPPKKIRKMDTDSMNSIIIAAPQTIKSKEPTKDTTIASKIEKTTADEVAKPPVPPPKPARPPKKITPQEVQGAIKSLQKNDPLEKADRPTQPSLLTKPKSTASLKSAISRRHRDSRDEGEFNVHVAMEPPYSCMGRHAFIDKMHTESAEQIWHPDPKRKAINAEILILTNFVGDAFVNINELIGEAHKLLEKHNVLMEDGRILVHINPNGAAAQYLQKVTTPEYVRLTAFGGQYGRRISLDAKLMDQYSMSLLMVIAFTPYINEGYRRHALALMKRNAPTIIQGTLPKERKKYGFPCNALDAAYKKDPFCFENVDKIRTYSSPNLSEVAKSDGTKKTTIEESKEVSAKLRRNTVK